MDFFYFSRLTVLNLAEAFKEPEEMNSKFQTPVRETQEQAKLRKMNKGILAQLEGLIMEGPNLAMETLMTKLNAPKTTVF